MKILVILSRIPYPLEKGDKLRAYYQIKNLSKNHEVHLFCLNDTKQHPDAVSHLSGFCSSIHIHRLRKSGVLFRFLVGLWTGWPFQVSYFFSLRALRQVRKLIETLSPDHIYCQLVRTAPYALPFSIPRTLDYQDVFSMGAERRAQRTKALRRLFWKEEYRRLLRYEYRVFDQFNNKTIISVPDRNCIPHPERDKIAIIRNGVDLIYFQPWDKPPAREVLFTGNMAYPPNADAAGFLVRDIMPRVWEKHPEIQVKLAGAAPTEAVRKLSSDKVIVTGWVDDMREMYATSCVFIAPMRLGTGLQNKLLEAMAMNLPCITTTLANDALEARPDKEILVGDTPEELAGHILTLLEDAASARQIASAGRDFIEATYSWEAETAKLEALLFSAP